MVPPTTLLTLSKTQTYLLPTGSPAGWICDDYSVTSERLLTHWSTFENLYRTTALLAFLLPILTHRQCSRLENSEAFNPRKCIDQCIHRAVTDRDFFEFVSGWIKELECVWDFCSWNKPSSNQGLEIPVCFQVARTKTTIRLFLK